MNMRLEPFTLTEFGVQPTTDKFLDLGSGAVQRGDGAGWHKRYIWTRR